MVSRIALFAPALIATLLAPELALAAPPADAAVDTAATEAPSEAPDTASEGASDAVAVEAPAPADAPTEGPQPAVATEAPIVDADPFIEPAPAEDPYVEEYDDPYDNDYREKRTVLELQSGYIGLGIAPGMTIHHKGFHPNTRFELEFGGTLEHEFRDLALSFGVVTHVTPYYERKKPSFGADVTATAILGPVYLRTGLGAVGGLPRGHLLNETTAGVGGVVGAGLTFGRAPMIRVGVDYDFRVTTKLEPVHTVLLAVRLACCRSD